MFEGGARRVRAQSSGDGGGEDEDAARDGPEVEGASAVSSGDVAAASAEGVEVLLRVRGRTEVSGDSEEVREEVAEMTSVLPREAAGTMRGESSSNATNDALGAAAAESGAKTVLAGLRCTSPEPVIARGGQLRASKYMLASSWNTAW